MKVTLSWLKEHLKIEASVEEISDRLTSLGLLVDSLVDPAAELKDFIIGHYKSGHHERTPTKIPWRVEVGYRRMILRSVFTFLFANHGNIQLRPN